MPEPLVQTRENLLGILREIEARGGGEVTVTIQETEPYSDQARLARERFDISPRSVSDPYTGRDRRGRLPRRRGDERRRGTGHPVLRPRALA